MRHTIAQRIVAAAVMILMAAPYAGAQGSDGDAGVWREYAEKLAPNALVRVRLRTGENVTGHIVAVGQSALRISPRTRVAVPLREVGFDAITAIDVRKESRWNPGAKVLLGVGVAFGSLLLLSAIALASGYD